MTNTSDEREGRGADTPERGRNTRRNARANGPVSPRALAVAAAISAAIALSSCAPRATVDLAPPDGKDPGALFGTSLTPTAESLLRKLTGAQGGDTGLFDVSGVTKSLNAAGIAVESVATDGGPSLTVSARSPKLDGLLGGAVSYKGGERAFRVTVDGRAVNAAIDLMPASTRDYLDLLMAPVFTGEAMTAEEYRDLVGAAYGKTIAGELDAARFSFTVKAPSPIKAATITEPDAKASVDGKTATFSIPLVSLLALEKPINLAVSW